MKRKIASVAAVLFFTSCGATDSGKESQVKQQNYVEHNQKETKGIQKYANEMLDLCNNDAALPEAVIGCTSWGTIGETLKASGYILEDVGFTAVSLKDSIVGIHKDGFKKGLLAGTTQVAILPLNVSGKLLGLAYGATDDSTVAIFNVTDNSLGTLKKILKSLDSVAAKSEVDLFRAPFLLGTAAVEGTQEVVNFIGATTRVTVALTASGAAKTIKILSNGTVLIFKIAGQGLTSVWNLVKKVAAKACLTSEARKSIECQITTDTSSEPDER